MSKNKNKLKNRHKQENGLKTVLMIFMSIFLILIFVNISSAIIDCSICHKTEPGKSAIKAKDTIEITDKTCLKCHNPDYPPTPIGYDTHLAHVGKYSAKVDYFTRHPKTADSLSCDNCHMNIGDNCQNCHIKNLPHIPPPLGYNCKGCHGELDKLFRHETIGLKIHDIFNIGTIKACTMCHNPDNMASLKLASGEVVSIQEPHRLCYQCHSGYYNLWNSGSHYSNKTIPSDLEIRMSNDMGVDVQGIRAGLEDTWRKENTCVNCHNPHNPQELYQFPEKEIDKTVGIDIKTIVLYVAVLIVIVSAAIILIVKKKKIESSELLSGSTSTPSRSILSKLKLSELKKLKLPKISIPISISVEKLDHADDVVKVEEKPKDKMEHVETGPVETGPIETGPVGKLAHRYDEAVSKHTTEIVTKVEKKSFLYRYRKDILFLSVICIILSSFYVIFGAFIPITVIVSESMSPHIEKGDVVFYTDISRINEIETYNNKNSINFENYGDVILYKPFGRENAVPYIHRAMYYVNQGDEMWPGGPKAPHAGYITKGDNSFTNPKYDQQGSISLNRPIKKEWIVGVARFRIPYIGYIRMILS